MKNYANLFEYTARPADSQRILEIESKLGKKLPDDYKMLLSETGGGILNLEKSFLTDISLPDGDTLEVVVQDIFGNGTASNGAHVDLIDYASFLMDEWEIPDEVLLFAASEDGMHQCFVINYGLPNFPEGAVLYVDTDPDGCIMPVATSVDTFLSKLGPYPDQLETVEDTDPDSTGINGALYSLLSEPLRKAISATPTPGIEKLLRQATELITRDLNPVITENSPESRTFYDVVYWIVQHIEPQHDPETFANGGRKGQTINFPELMRKSFIVPGQKYELGYTLASLIMWWDRRVREGVLKETDNGFILDEDYASSVFDQLRQGKIQE
ncbi:hypothetical protein GWO52_02800 [Corynebacterium macginleyi]|uniref:SMI1/KNR4 family protein n=1 Tax=Corynebacterium macginleyi TaxID=38290 RepID=UPI00190D3288|nr:SMI1/KNR4 family protein [Corynebacterium macginleyi]MBK4137416.1 hypothetical protein [Corynebacterium macginleyi]